MKFVLLVEGKTEKDTVAAFLKRWLDLQLTQPVGIQVVSFNGYAELASKMATKARLYLEGPKQEEIIAVVGLLDLYGPNFFPPELETAQKRYEWGVKHFRMEVNRDRFRMFFAVHEYEAWLLSDPKIFSPSVKSALPAKKIAQPEQVNFDEPPAKLLDKIYKQTTKRGYKKIVYGKQLFAKLDPATAVSKCPYLKTMLEEMLSLAKNAGQ